MECIYGNIAYLQQHVTPQNVDTRDIYGRSLLECAILAQAVESVRFLLSLGIDVEHLSKFQTSTAPLSLAARIGSLPIIKALLEYGADVNKSNPYGHTALMSASTVEIAAFLIAHGASVHPTVSDGSTAFTYAVHRGCYPQCELLIAMGASRNVDLRSCNPPHPHILDLVESPLPLQRICGWQIYIQSMRT